MSSMHSCECTASIRSVAVKLSEQKKICSSVGVIPCQINKQNAFAFQISTKLGRLVPSGKLLNHFYFGCVKLYGFGIISHSFFQHFGPCTTFLTVIFLLIGIRRNVAYHLVGH